MWFPDLNKESKNFVVSLLREKKKKKRTFKSTFSFEVGFKRRLQNKILKNCFVIANFSLRQVLSIFTVR